MVNVHAERVHVLVSSAFIHLFTYTKYMADALMSIIADFNMQWQRNRTCEKKLLLRGSCWHLTSIFASAFVYLRPSITITRCERLLWEERQRDSKERLRVDITLQLDHEILRIIVKRQRHKQTFELIWSCRTDLVKNLLLWPMEKTKWHPCLDTDSGIFYFESRHGKTMSSKCF